MIHVVTKHCCQITNLLNFFSHRRKLTNSANNQWCSNMSHNDNKTRIVCRSPEESFTGHDYRKNSALCPIEKHDGRSVVYELSRRTLVLEVLYPCPSYGPVIALPGPRSGIPSAFGRSCRLLNHHNFNYPFNNELSPAALATYCRRCYLLHTFL